MFYLNEERKLWRKGYKRVACLDEAGRGPLAGPVTAAAVTVDPAKFKRQKSEVKGILGEIKDSKKLTPKKREEIYKILTNHPDIEWGAGKVSEKVIDKINILEATKLAMEKAIKNLEKKFFQKPANPHKKTHSHTFYDRRIYENKKGRIDFLIIDGNFKINSSISQKSIIKADEKVFSCIAASIISKVTRDRLMKRYHKKYPRYSFDKHKGYPTKYHLKMLRRYGCCKIHRKSFKPISQMKNIK